MRDVEEELRTAPIAAARAPTRETRIDPRALDRDAIEVVRRLQRYEHTAYIVGGCVRDLLVGLAPKDYDVSTSARPEQIKRVFRNSRIIGRRFRLAHIFFRGGKIIETATFRGHVQGGEDDNAGDLLITRDNVWGTEEEDAQRRDFTINGLMYDVTSARIIDHVGGLEDIERRRIRTIGDPDIRVQEDPVRILRAARFSAKLGFEIEPRLLAAMRAHARDILRCPRARVLEEIFKLLRVGHSRASVEVLQTTGVLPVVLPDVAAYLEIEPATSGAPTMLEYLGALDSLIARRGPVSDAVVLAALYHAPLDRALAQVDPSRQLLRLEECLAELGQALASTRRVRERLRQILLAQRHFRRAPDRRSRRRVAPSTLARRAYFADALDLFELWAEANATEAEAVAEWRASSPENPRARDEADEPAEDEQPAAPRRRRRRHRH